MPPRHAYWTILVDEQPTAFRAALLEDLQPTFKRLKQKHPSTRLVWFQNGKVWNSRLDAQAAMQARGEMGRRGDVRQVGHRRPREGGGGFRDRPRAPRPERTDRRDPSGKLEWKPKGEAPPRAKPEARPKLEWKPKGAPRTATPQARGTRHEAPKRDRNWRPGGEHRDPRQKYKDAKKAKWSRFKQTIRKRWEAKQPGKKKDEE